MSKIVKVQVKAGMFKAEIDGNTAADLIHYLDVMRTFRVRKLDVIGTTSTGEERKLGRLIVVPRGGDDVEISK